MGLSEQAMTNQSWEQYGKEHGLLEPRSLFGANFNIVDQHKFKQAIQLLRESTGNLPMFVADNVITWNKNFSFMHDEFFVKILSGHDSNVIEQSTIWRLYVLIYFAETCQDLPGDFVELGCNKGSTAKRLTERVDFQKLGKRFWLFDLFEWKQGDAHTYLPEHDDPNMHLNVLNRFADQPWVNVIKGSVPDSFDQGFPDCIAFAHIDMNDPAPEAGALNKVLPLLSPGGIIIFDDYGWWGYSRQKKILDPIADQHNLSILELPTGQGILLKR
mgnify:CR=1 FL=1